ncbi:MAG: hypothetical protein K0S44_232 [Bacteroidetes bacterium]|jgi:hypothetical protein|nr:hypothetical protein [Bacteroidota bacterium]
MTDFNKIKFSGADMIKLLGFLSVVLTMWYDLKQDFSVYKEYQIGREKLFEYRLARLEDNRPDYNNDPRPKVEATLPKEPQIEVE